MIILVCAIVQTQSLGATPNPAFLSVFSRNLGSIFNPDFSKVKVTIQHSLREGPSGRQTHTFKSFSDFESWLRSKEHGGKEPGEDLLPTRVVSTTRKYRHETYEYENQGLLHNTLYLSRVRLSLGPKGLSIVEVVLYDGD
jgi:hypothetical protein